MTQHDMRRIALQTLYLANQSQDPDVEEICIQAQKALDIKKYPEFSKSLVEGVLKHKADLDNQLSKFIKEGWRIDRLNQIDRAILELSLYEIQNSSVIEPVSAVNEALNLCDEFSSPKSKAFVNGILGNFIKKN
ncbi:N utilization substance protein B [Lactobacillus colini]|uniref:N utilization substance protein B n=1 Tax=Lactobacillus colini TaxID=1819254 RepID=A0ABS4MB67_9LACO|nr:transcription antitermination factor NusB [Lactobacillus colini]MBP2056919.1 N utilization substance protein B [Lactobacillus colini]